MAILKAVHHLVVGGGRELVCHWPRQGGLWCWGDEMLAGYIESPCAYDDPADDHGMAVHHPE